MKKPQPDSGGHGLRGLERGIWVDLAEPAVRDLVDTELHDDAELLLDKAGVNDPILVWALGEDHEDLL